MDPSSIITQVAAPPTDDDDDPVSAPDASCHAYTKKDPASASASASASATAVLAPQSTSATGGNTSPPPTSPPPVTFTVRKERKKRSNFLCSLICCLGKGSSLEKENGGAVSASAAASSAAGTTSSSSSSAAAAFASAAGDRTDHGVTSAVGNGGGGGGVKGAKPLLPDPSPEDAKKMCVVIDLDETLVHSSFKPINNADFIVPVEIDGTIHQVYVLKRPFVDEFLCRMGELFECVLFTASLAKYADPVTDLLDKWDVFHSRLFRESCVFHRGNYVKDLGRLGRELQKSLIVDNSPASYIFHPDNAIPVASWFDDMNDRELLDLIPFMENLSKVDSVYAFLQSRGNKPSASSVACSSGAEQGGKNQS